MCIRDSPECACGVEAIYYRINYGPWIEYTGPFTIDEECKHTIQWYSIDYLGNAEQIHSTVVNVDSSPPVTSLSYGTPYYTDGIEEWITTSTPITLTAIDYPECACGVEAIYYRINYGPWIEYSGAFNIGIECSHIIEYYAVDYLGNEEPHHIITVNVDDSSPSTTLNYGTPYYTDGIDEWITTSTPITLTAVDEPECACGVKEIWYNYGAGWNVVAGDIASFNISDECYHTLQYYAVDNLGNIETMHSVEINVDSSPPETTISFGMPYYYDGNNWITTSTPIYLNATDYPDCACGVEAIYYRINLSLIHI